MALLAGISIEYYTRLERGNARGVSDEVLEGLARALQLEEVERAHLLDLVRTANAARPARRRTTPQRVRPSVQRLLDSMTATGMASPMPPWGACAPRPAAPPDDRALTELVGELSVRSQDFRVRWAAHDLHYYRSGTQPFHHLAAMATAG